MVEGLDKSQSLILFWFATSKNILGANHSTDLQKLLSSDNILLYLGYIKPYCSNTSTEKEIPTVLIHSVW